MKFILDPGTVANNIILQKACIYLLLISFYVHSFSLKLVKSLKNAHLGEIYLFQKICSTTVKVNKKGYV
jgi:hypothetical protein